MTIAPKSGLTPFRRVGSGVNTHGLTPYAIASGYATSIGRGDPVKLHTDGTLIKATNGADAIGVFMGVKYTDSVGAAQFKKLWTASTTGTQIEALVMDDPFATFLVKGEGPIPLVQKGGIFALNLDSPSAVTGVSGATVKVLAEVIGDVNISAITDLGENLTGADDADSFTIRTTQTSTATTITLADGDGQAQLLAKLNAVPNISASLTAAGFLKIVATDGYDIVSAAGTGALWDDLFAGTVGTSSEVVAANAGLVKVIDVIDRDVYALEVVLVNHSLRDDG